MNRKNILKKYILESGRGFSLICIGLFVMFTINISKAQCTIDECRYTLILTDSAANGWDGASIDVVINEDIPGTNYKMAPNDGDSLIIPICVVDGVTIDLTYWTGANEPEHGWTLYDPFGNVALDTNNQPLDFQGNSPAQVTLRTKAFCANPNCEDGDLELFFQVNGDIERAIFWEIRDVSDLLIYDVDPSVTNVDLNSDIELTPCATYMLILGSTDGTDWNNAFWEIYQNDKILVADVPITTDFVDGKAEYILNIPCAPTIDIPTFSFSNANMDCLVNDNINLPLVEPIICSYAPSNCSPEVRVKIEIDSQVVANYSFDTPNTFMAGNIGDLIDNNNDGIAESIDVDLLNAFPGGLAFGAYEICYSFLYNCGGLTQNIFTVSCDTINFVSDGVGQIACNDALNVSISYQKDCEGLVLPDMVLESFSGCESDYILTVNGTVNNIIDENHVGKNLTYNITHIGTQQTCWGNIFVEDKTPPIICADDYQIICNSPAINSNTYSHDTQLKATVDQGIVPAGIFIPLGNLDNTAIGEALHNCVLTIEVEHTDPSDLSYLLHCPSSLNLAPIALQHGTLNNLVNIPINEFNANFIQELEGDWAIEVFDNDNSPVGGNPNDTGFGKLVRSNLTFSHGARNVPTAKDCCLDSLFLLNETYHLSNCVATGSGFVVGQLNRIWQAVDCFGNTSNTTQTIDLLAPTFSDITFPDDITFECKPNICDNLRPDQTGYPIANSNNLDTIAAAICNMSFLYEDLILSSCGNTKKIQRTWTIVNSCTGTSKTHEQIIVVEDTKPPGILNVFISVIPQFVPATGSGSLGMCMTGSGSVMTGSGMFVESINCKGNVFLDLRVQDNCSEVEPIQVQYPEGGGLFTNATNIITTFITDTISIYDLNVGETEFAIKAIDGCANYSERMASVFIKDDQAPTAICNKQLNISLGGDGKATLTAELFDEGSYDCSGIESLLVKKVGGCLQNQTWTPTVTFSCCDLGLVDVELQVTDSLGNIGYCCAQVLVEDKLPPTIICPDDKTISCDDLHDIVFDVPTISDNCVDLSNFTDTSNLDNCNTGTVQRTWQIEGVTCTQTIFVESVSDYFISFPEDVNISDCPDDLNLTGEPQILDKSCELIFISKEDQLFTIVPDACYKIERTWTVINECVFDENAANTDSGFFAGNPNIFLDDGDGYFKYKQTIKILDVEAPIINCPDDLSFCASDEDCNGYAELTVEATDGCSANNNLAFQYKIDLFDDGNFELINSENDASDFYPIGTHRIKWSITDGCGNESICTYLFTIEDCNSPTPVCLNGISIPNMNSDGCVTIPASTLLESATDNCSDQSLIEQSVQIKRANELTMLQEELTLCCEDLGTIEVEIHVFDENGNNSFCKTYIQLQDNTDVCEEEPPLQGIIAGRIATEEGDPINAVSIDLTGTPLIQNYTTDANGQYRFENLMGNTDYTITPYKDIDPLKGVTTFDLVLISKHILDLERLDSPYKIIAADVNNDGKVTTFDVVQLRQLILFVITDFPSNTSWRFIDKNYTFPNPLNPWASPFRESVNYPLLSESKLMTDFIAIKVGDVNYD